MYLIFSPIMTSRGIVFWQRNTGYFAGVELIKEGFHLIDPELKLIY